MRIATYNIMSGGFDGYDLHSPVPPRLPEIQTAVSELGADVIGLIDTFHWDELFTQKQIGELFGYQYVTCISLNDIRLQRLGHDNGLTLMSNIPWLNCQILPMGTRSALKATFDLNGKEVTVILAYLDDLDEDVRLAQAKTITDSLDDPRNTVIMGDLNTLSPADLESTNAGLRTFYANNSGVEEKLGPVVRQMQRGEVITHLHLQGFIDAGVNAGSTMPSNLFLANVEKPFLRLDYCLHGSGLTVRDITVGSTETMQKTSDHLPVSFTVE